MADVVYRTGYGYGTYGSAVYGLGGATKDGASTVITASTTASAIVRARIGAATVVTSSSTASNAACTRNVGAAVSASTSTAAAAGKIKDVAGSTSCTSSASSAAELIQLVAADVTPSASASSAAQLIQQPSASAAPSLSASVHFIYLYTFSGVSQSVSTLTASGFRKRVMSSLVRARLSTSSAALKKWEPIPTEPELWSEIPKAVTPWEPVVASAPDIWQDAA